MENFLTNNVPFEDTDDAIRFLVNVKTEDRKYEILNYIDAPITQDELLSYIVHHVKEGVELDSDVLQSIISGMDLETTSRIFYKNQLSLLLENNWFKQKLEYLVYNPNDDEKVKEISDLVLEFVFYDYLYEDRYKRAMKDRRKVVITIDTDSVFCNVNKHVLRIGDELSLKLDAKMKNDIVNILIKITTGALGRIFWTLTTNMGLIEKAKPIINMKQEFLYQRIMLTRNKKSLKFCMGS